MSNLFNAALRFGTLITAAGLAMSASIGCGGSETEDPKDPSAGTKNTYILIHGAFADISAWDKVVPLLTADGSEVITPELPAHGKDTTPVSGATLQAYTDVVVHAIDSASGPVILVGHSLAGAIVSQAAEARPDKVKKLVYLAAFLFEDGSKVTDALASDKDATLGMYVTPSSDGTTLSFKDGWVEGAFCQDCSAADAAAVRAAFRPEPAAPLGTPIHVTQQNWGRVPRVYIKTLTDHAISPAKQSSFYAALPCEKVISIDAGHCPFLTKPVELSNALKSL